MKRWIVACALVACGAPRATPTSLRVGVLGAKTVELFVVDQQRRTEGTIDCSDLLSGEVSIGSPDLVRLYGPRVVDVAADLVIDGLPPGEQNRVVFVNMLDGEDGTGRVVGRACRAVSVAAGRLTSIDLTVEAP